MPYSRSLLVFAHADEAMAFHDVPHLVTGVGKINAVMRLTRAICEGSVDFGRIVALGTAGAITEEAQLDTVYQITKAIQHDFSLDSPTLETEGDVIAPELTIATGDQFVTSDEERARIARLGAQLVDMESYAYISVCHAMGAKLQVFKVPSDFADSDTSMRTWDEIVAEKSRQLRAFAEESLPGLC